MRRKRQLFYQSLPQLSPTKIRLLRSKIEEERQRDLEARFPYTHDEWARDRDQGLCPVVMIHGKEACHDCMVPKSARDLPWGCALVKGRREDREFWELDGDTFEWRLIE